MLVEDTADALYRSRLTRPVRTSTSQVHRCVARIAQLCARYRPLASSPGGTPGGRSSGRKYAMPAISARDAVDDGVPRTRALLPPSSIFSAVTPR